MSALEDLQRHRAFAPSIVFGESLASVHVPFDHLTGTTSYETRVARTVDTGGLVVVVGGTGEGKSGLTSYALRLEDGRLPIPVPVSVPEPGGVSTDMIPTLVLQGLANAMTPLDAKTMTEVDAAARGKRTPRRVGGKLNLKGLTVEVGDLLRDQPVGHRAQLDTIRQAADVIAANDLNAVIVLDDTDKWLDDRVEHGQAFFQRSLSALVDLGLPVVALAHPEYFASNAIPEHFDTHVNVPRLDPECIRQILDRRVAVVLGDATSTAEVFTPEAADRLCHHYEDAAITIRRVVQIASEALIEAIEANTTVISEGALQNAIGIV